MSGRVSPWCSDRNSRVRSCGRRERRHPGPEAMFPLPGEIQVLIPGGRRRGISHGQDRDGFRLHAGMISRSAAPEADTLRVCSPLKLTPPGESRGSFRKAGRARCPPDRPLEQEQHSYWPALPVDELSAGPTQTRDWTLATSTRLPWHQNPQSRLRLSCPPALILRRHLNVRAVGGRLAS